MAADSAGRPLPLFGQSLFEQSPSTFAPIDLLQIPDDYMIGPGDQLQIRVWGQLQADLRVTVDRSGQIYIPRVGQVSVAGGTMPQWRRDGKELFYLTGNKLMAVPVNTEKPTFESGAPSPLFDIRLGVSLRNHFTISSDGQRFLANTALTDDASSVITVLTNWTVRLKR